MIRFTKDEKIVLLFLLAALFVGTAVLYYKKSNPTPSCVIEFNEKEIEETKKVNINKATKEGLMKLKHIGPALAGRIIDYREKYGLFNRPEDIKNVKGIGEKTFAEIKENIVLE